ncbi:cobalamin B12-binding domain-containing protein [Aeromicrobium chenweiae]|uniref:cobalamin B12-binding domain-containing protein n=1 Tax=Aeromicrobium chenweiae TaxID=2079793 RepID=UPI00131EF1EE|nr:B12-binding domain-containing protein [Aeromicrobium chenweiae]
MSSPTDPAAAYGRLLETFDVHGASDLVVELLDGGMSVERIITDVLAPAQVGVGERWESGAWSVADEHVATSVTEAALAALTHAARPRRGTQTRHVAVACAEGEWHSLPARMAATIAGATGEVRVTMLGASLPAEQLHRRLSVGDIDMLALSCSMPTNLIGAARCIAAAHDVAVPVMIGGRALGGTHDRAHAIGADAWAPDASSILTARPELMGRDTDIPTEVMLLDAVDDAVVALTYDRMLAAFPRLAAMTAYQHARTREDLGWMARHTAAALLTDDPSIAADVLTWLCTRLSDFVPASVITDTAALLAETLEPQAPHGAQMLRRGIAAVDAGTS